MTDKELTERSVRLGLAHKANPTLENKQAMQQATLEVLTKQIDIGANDG